MTPQEKALLINADKFLILSGMRTYFFQQKDFYQDEINRLTNLYQKAYYKKKNYKKKMIEAEGEVVDVKNSLGIKISDLQAKVVKI